MFTNVTLLFFVLLIPVAGFIAWAGDRIGHKSGKKRHTLFGLRPRHTAMVFTIGAGVAIGVVSFGLMWVVSETFRTVVRDGATLYGRNRQLKQENEQQARLLVLSKQQAQESKAAALRSQTEAAQASIEQRKAEASRTSALSRLHDANALLQSSTARLTTANVELGNQRGLLEREQAHLGAVQKLLQTKTDRVQVTEAQIKAAKNRVAQAERQVAQATERQKTARQEAQVAELRLASLRKTAEQALQEQKRQQEKQLADLNRSLSDLQAQNATQEAKAKEQKKELAQLGQELSDRRQELARLVANADALRRNQITYQVGEEVDRISIRPGYNVWRIEAILDSFLTLASKKAEARGAFRTKDARAVFILPRPLSVVETNADAGAVLARQGEPGKKLLTEDDALRAAAAAIRKSNEDVVVVLLASTNAVAGEPVAVDLKTYRNPVVLMEDAKIAETTLDGTGSREQVADALYGFLRNDVRLQLLRAGVIPPAKGGDTVASASDEAGSIVSLSGSEWLQLLDEVRQAGARAKVTVLTTKTLRAGDAVSLRFEVRSPQTASR